MIITNVVPNTNTLEERTYIKKEFHNAIFTYVALAAIMLVVFTFLCTSIMRNIMLPVVLIGIIYLTFAVIAAVFIFWIIFFIIGGVQVFEHIDRGGDIKIVADEIEKICMEYRVMALDCHDGYSITMTKTADGRPSGWGIISIEDKDGKNVMATAIQYKDSKSDSLEDRVLELREGIAILS